MNDDDLILIARRPEWQKEPLKTRFAKLEGVYRRERRRYLPLHRVIGIMRIEGDGDPRRTVRRLIKQGVLGVHR